MVCAQLFLVRLTELRLGSPNDLLTLSNNAGQNMFRVRQFADDDMDADVIYMNDTTIFLYGRTMKVALETDEVRASKGFRIEFAVGTPLIVLVLFELRCTELGALHAHIGQYSSPRTPNGLRASRCAPAQAELLQVRNSSGVLSYPQLHGLLWRLYV